MTTPNLAITHILQSQAQKEVTANAAFDALDNSANRALSLWQRTVFASLGNSGGTVIETDDGCSAVSSGRASNRSPLLAASRNPTLSGATSEASSRSAVARHSS